MASTVVPDALLARRSRALTRYLPAALQGDPAAVHRARIASRRIRELLPLLGHPRKTARRVRKVTRALGRVRELDVALALLESDELSSGVPLESLVVVREHVRRLRGERAAKLLVRLRKGDVDKLKRRLSRPADESAGEGVRPARRYLAARLTRRARALRAAMTEAGGLYVPERLHDVRVASKKLRYGLEIAAELGAPDAARLAARVRRVQITLGQLQDRTIVLREVQQAAGGADAGAALDGLHVLTSRLEQSCRRLHAEYLAGRDGMTEVFARVRRDVVPELTRSQKPAPLKAVLPARTTRAAGGARR